tara:strand:+ start:278 stop:616 length:339 start_codon:yes stop_codon:yes gene_type:complete
MCKRVLYLALVKTTNTMKTLFERLRPEQRERLQEMGDEMPFMQDSLVKTLQRNTLLIHVPFGDVIDIVRYLGDGRHSIGDGITAIYDCFEDIEKTGDDPSLQSDHNAQTTNT